MTNTQGLDALAALCGSSAVASEPSAASEPSVAKAPAQASLPSGSLYAQQVAQQQAQASLQHALALRQAQAATASQVPPHLLQAQIALLQQQQQQQQQQQHAQAQAIAAQILAAQQQHAPAAQPNLAALVGLAAASGQVVPGAVASPALQVSSPTHQAAAQAQASPSTLAMPPPPKVVPTLPLSNSAKAGGAKAKKSKSARRPQAAASAQPPIQDIISEWEDKKHAKRAANRLSAHLSRKRKKMFIEDLKDENVELRRKEQILRSIPDLIVVFDSSGCISFVSHSVTRFLDYSAEELENTSFWERLTEESVRSIKSAFMDALAVKRSPEEDSTPLLNGESMSISMLHKDKEGEEEGMQVSLKGVVHFSGENPECVCSIRPEYSAKHANKKAKAAVAEESSAVRPHAVPAVGAPSHQISDIDSEKS